MKKSVIALFLILFPFSIWAQEYYSNKNKLKTKLYSGIIIQNSKIEPNLTNSYNSSISINLGIRKELAIYHSHFEFGLEFVNQGLSFNSYYFSPGYSSIYNQNFEFQHSIRINELLVPLLVSFQLTNHSNRGIIPSINLGWILRGIINSTASIIDNKSQIELYQGPVNVAFQYPLLARYLGSMLQAGIDFQINNLRTHKGIFIELNFKYDITQLEYFGYLNSNDILFQNSIYAINIGYRF